MSAQAGTTVERTWTSPKEEDEDIRSAGEEASISDRVDSLVEASLAEALTSDRADAVNI